METVDLLRFEHQLWKAGFRKIAGLDEAGRGPLAGPVVAAAVIFPVLTEPIDGIRDSKLLSHEARLRMKEIIESRALAVGVGIVDEKDIDELNILGATFKAMQMAVAALGQAPDYILIDGRKGPKFETPSSALIKGDGRSLSIAAASIIAKVTRDEIMEQYEALYPQYGFARHKGYPTRLHIEAIRKHGLCPIHRRSFKPKALADVSL